MKYNTLSSKVIFSNPYWDYKLDKYILPNEKAGDYHFVDSRGSCMVIPVLEKNTFVMVRQYRYLNHKFSIEFPGGGLAMNKRIDENAIDELEEETGFIAQNIELIGEFNPCNGITNETCNVFLATGLTKPALHKNQKSPDDSEEFEILTFSKDEIIKKISSNEIWDGMTLASWSLFNLSKKGLEL